MSPSTQNIWIRIIRSFIRYIRDIFQILQELLLGKKTKQSWPILDTIIEKGPDNYKKNPTAIKAGRSIFTLILSIISYDKK